MWKYILIIAFVIFAIREINLMNESLYIAPDTHKIVAEDKTVIGTVEKVIVKKLQKLRHESTGSTEENQTVTYVKAPLPKPVTHPKSERNETTQAPKPAQKPLPNLTSVEEKNITETPKVSTPATLPPSLEKVEEEIVKKTGKPVTLKRPEKIPATKTEKPLPQQKPQPEKRAAPVHSPEQNVTTAPATGQQYPAHFQSAEERVRAILEEMRKGKN